MHTRTLLLVAAALGATSIAAVSTSPPRLTPARLVAISQLPPANAKHHYMVEISDLGEICLNTTKLTQNFEQVRDVIFPTQFEGPKAAAGSDAVTPTTPTEFCTKQTGWRIRLTAKPEGSMVSIYGEADYTTAAYVRAGYGAVAGPVYNEAGEVITPNKLEMPRLQTTTTHFHVFAVPGESYAVTLYRGENAEMHLLRVTAD
jgi:hypothetical protein